jgi:hypothetical protein
MNTRLLQTIATLLLITVTNSLAQDAKAPAAPSDSQEKAKTDAKGDKNAGNSEGVEGQKPAASSQSDVASKTATFEKIGKDADAYTSALEAHDLAKAHDQVEKKGAFRGKVARIFEPRGGTMAILNFDAKYQSALTALVRKENFSRFPDLKALVGKDVVVAGKFTDYQGRAQIILTSPEQIKLVE